MVISVRYFIKFGLKLEWILSSVLDTSILQSVRLQAGWCKTDLTRSSQDRQV